MVRWVVTRMHLIFRRFRFIIARRRLSSNLFVSIINYLQTKSFKCLSNIGANSKTFFLGKRIHFITNFYFF